MTSVTFLWGITLTCFKPLHRVQGFSVVADLKIKFGAGNGAGIADGRNHFSGLDGIPG